MMTFRSKIVSATPNLQAPLLKKGTRFASRVGAGMSRVHQGESGLLIVNNPDFFDSAIGWIGGNCATIGAGDGFITLSSLTDGNGCQFAGQITTKPLVNGGLYRTRLVVDEVFGSGSFIVRLGDVQDILTVTEIGQHESIVTLNSAPNFDRIDLNIGPALIFDCKVSYLGLWEVG